MRFFWLITVAILVSCISSTRSTAAPPKAPPPCCGSMGSKMNQAVLSKIKRAEFTVSGFTSHEVLECKPSDVPLDAAAVKKFFTRGRAYDSRTIHDKFDVVDCYLDGSLQVDGQTCHWEIMPTRVGFIACDYPETYVVCGKKCNDLFGE